MNKTAAANRTKIFGSPATNQKKLGKFKRYTVELSVGFSDACDLWIYRLDIDKVYGRIDLRDPDAVEQINRLGVTF